jgi:hypothetical protein
MRIDLQYIKDMPTTWRVIPQNVKPFPLGESIGDAEVSDGV